MKAIIYAGIGLFSVATVYGLADYYISQRKGTLDKLYVEEEITAAPAVEEKNTAVIPAVLVEAPTIEIKVVTEKEKSGKKLKRSARKIEMEDFSRARIPEAVIEEPENASIEKKEELIPNKPVAAPVEKTGTINLDERKITMDKFSRAPLKRKVKKAEVISKDN